MITVRASGTETEPWGPLATACRAHPALSTQGTGAQGKIRVLEEPEVQGHGDGQVWAC